MRSFTFIDIELFNIFQLLKLTENSPVRQDIWLVFFLTISLILQQAVHPKFSRSDKWIIPLHTVAQRYKLKGKCFQSNLTLPMHNLKGSTAEWLGVQRPSGCLKTHRRVPRMTSSMDPAALDWLGLGTRGSRVREGGFLRRADWAARGREEKLWSSGRRGRVLLLWWTLEPGRRHGRSSASLRAGGAGE